MVDTETEHLYVKLISRMYEIVAQQKIQIQAMQELLSKDKKDIKSNVGKSKLPSSSNS